MVGIPKNIKTKQDILNLVEMSKQKEVNKNELIVLLEELKKDDVFKLPIIEKEKDYFIINKTERNIPAIYSVEPYIIPETEESDIKNETLKLYGEVPKEDYIEIIVPNEYLETINITKEEIEQLIKELQSL